MKYGLVASSKIDPDIKVRKPRFLYSHSLLHFIVLLCVKTVYGIHVLQHEFNKLK